MRRFVLAHGAASAAVMWLSTLGTVVALRSSWVPVDQLVGGPPRALRGSDAAVLVLAATLPSVLRPRLLTWERINPRPSIRTLKVLLGLGAVLATVLLTWIEHTWIVPTSQWRPAVVNAVSMSAVAQVACALAGPALAPPGCLALYWAVVAVQQHEPASQPLLSFLAATPPHAGSLTATAALVLVSSACAAATLGRSRWASGRDRNGS